MSNLQNAQSFVLWRVIQKQSIRVRAQNKVVVVLAFLLSLTLLSFFFTINYLDKRTDWFLCEEITLSSESHGIQPDNNNRFFASNTEKTIDEEEIQSIFVHAILLQIGEERALSLKYNITKVCFIDNGNNCSLFVKYEFKPKGFFESLFSKTHTDTIFIDLK